MALSKADMSRVNIKFDHINLPAALTAAGLKVPAELTKALEAAEWTAAVPDEPTWEKVEAATTETEFSKAVRAYAEATATRKAVQEVAARANSVMLPRLGGVIQQVTPEIFAALAERFDVLAGEFATEARELPELSVASMNPGDAERFIGVRNISTSLNHVYHAYKVLYGENNGDVGWHRIAGIESTDQLKTVYDSWLVHKAGAMAPLCPWWPIVKAGAGLRLVTPRKADEAYKAVLDSERPVSPEVHPGQRGIGR